MPLTKIKFRVKNENVKTKGMNFIARESEELLWQVCCQIIFFKPTSFIKRKKETNFMISSALQIIFIIYWTILSELEYIFKKIYIDEIYSI